MNLNDQIRKDLFEMQDLKYKAFQEKLIPTVDPNKVIGVRSPQLRAYAKKMKKEPEIGTFLDHLPHKYYDENNLHAFLLEQEKDFDICVARLNQFLPYVDNWATCDCMRPKCFKRHLKELLPEIEGWLNAKDVYAVRFGIGMLLSFYLDESFEESYLARVAEIESDEYYINMMIAWYFATALAKQYDSAVQFLEQEKLPLWVHNKTIQKAVESYRVTEEQKTYLRSLRRKK